ncbi:Octanoyltransferase LipM [Rubripirellula obstinata]|uniref:Octanoyltransferase LipM n=1 Tax=Rubripirellula obstinata TaxID=406547 RepID=A0A5B1CJV2_9BACT|nr:biotin/lipoate A/B protein ligase family protein [Rubripirellula obstinata]KAA1260561.1 Octanoyltransferase LipM [Rubripirellula obstinata]
MNDATSVGRLIGVDSSGGLTDAESAAMNMSLDQAILESVDQTGVACLRFYRWSQPTLSLGYFQKFADRQTHTESLDLPCVRRASGGGAIVHHHELTYSIAIPDDHQSLITKPSANQSDKPKIRTSIGANARLYALVHEAIADAVREFGVTATPYRLLQSDQEQKKASDADEPVLCFQRRTSEDLIVAGYKILGSAQRRGKRSLLQHGSLLVRSSPQAPQLPGLIDLGAKITTIEDLIEPITRQIQSRLMIQWSPSSINEAERQLGTEIASRRFLAYDWTHRR